MDEITVGQRGAVLEIAFNRPARRNAITAAMYTALAEAVLEGEGRGDVRVLLLHGEGGAFTAGNDLEDFLQSPPDHSDTPVFRFLRALGGAGKPVVAAVEGVAVGIGTTILLHCELAYAGEGARFQLPFASLGLVPEFASSYLLPLVAGHRRAAELLMLGEPFDAHRARECGLVNRVTPAGEALAAAREAAEKLAALPERSVALTKALLKAPHAQAVRAQMEAEGEHFRRMLSEPAAKAAFAAFLAKRKAKNP